MTLQYRSELRHVSLSRIDLRTILENSLDVTRRRVPPDRQLPSGVDVAGVVVVGYLQSATETSPIFADRFEEQLSIRGITNPEVGEWYPATALQDALFETREVADESALVDAGAEMARLLDWPDAVSTAEGGLTEMSNRHEAAHRNVGDSEIGGYRPERLDDGAAVIDCAGFPYPTPVARGAIRGTLELFVEDPEAITVSEHPAEDHADGDDDTPTLRFDVSW